MVSTVLFSTNNNKFNIIQYVKYNNFLFKVHKETATLSDRYKLITLKSLTHTKCRKFGTIVFEV